MSLDVQRLEKVRELANGVLQAQCPACSESGRDKSGQHLRVFPDGAYGCCVYPKDPEHRKRIFALAGDRVGAPLQAHAPVIKAARQQTFPVAEWLLPMAPAMAPENLPVPDRPMPTIQPVAVPVEPVAGQRMPYFDASGGLVIPFTSLERYHWWKDGVGQSIEATKAELRTS